MAKTNSITTGKISPGLSMLAVVLLLLSSLFATACGSTDNGNGGAVSDVPYTIRLTCQGTQDFKGTITVIKADGQIDITNVEGTAPLSYNYTGVQVDCTFQKTTATGYLKATIMRGNKAVAESDTLASYGTIWITGR